jgi:hypothetical protein
MIFLDFEASAAMGGYPIEVGFCIVDEKREMRAAAMLIRHDEWLDDFSRWDWQASQIHNIDRAHLMELGRSPREVMNWLNAELAGMVAVADSPYDSVWFRELVEAAGIKPSFGLVDDISVAFTGPEIPVEAMDEAADRVCRKTHRADRDAKHLAVRYIMSLGALAPVHRLHLTAGGYERRPLGNEG